MRKLCLSAIAVLSWFIIRAQVSEAELATAKQLLLYNSKAIGLSTVELDNSIIAATYKLQGPSDMRMVYLQQSFKGLPVLNELQVLAFRDDQLVSNTGSRMKDIVKLAQLQDIVPGLNAADAIRIAAAEAKLVAPELIIPQFIREGRKFEYTTLGIAVENITAELLWLPVENKKQVRLAWQVFLAPVHSSDYWLIRIDAMNGSILEKQNLTITCNWGHDDHSGAEHTSRNYSRARQNFVLLRKEPVQVIYRPFLVSSASYRCIPYPAESPTHLGIPSAIAINPWLMSPGNASSLGWHNDGNNDHDSTRGNNVWAAEDRAATNNVIERAALSSTPAPNLNFDFTPDYTVAPTTTSPPNQSFAITNLFYWNNLMHDISYLYGFDEVSGNFQNSNLGRGGTGNDYVIADAQDGAGSNNASFATPVDGTRPRMQMYLWTAPNPDRDGDLDNGIIAHEYGHGISNRLTGGPDNSSCLGNAEHGGEGWSDFFGLMMTTNWATATVNDGAIPRGIGTYVRNQPVSGMGIRDFRYSTDLTINPLVYSASLPTAVHDRGEYWCMALWEMTWELIQVAGINPNLFNPTGGGGNTIAMKLVMEGLRLQPCNPGFIDARNAILKADTLFFGAQYSCAIWRAFAKRGMGRTASQGSSASVTDQVPSFLTDNGALSITQNSQQVQEGNTITYNNRITAGVCSPLSNAFITDTLPANVTYVSGGTYNSANRVISFGPINLANTQSLDYSFTVSVNNGSYFTPVEHFNETVPNALIPASWTASSNSSTNWTTSTVQSVSGPNSFFAPNPTSLTDHQLATTSGFLLNGSASSYTTLSFWHLFNTEDGWDGGVVEISTNGGISWSDLGSKMIQNGYNGSLGTGSGNLLGGRQAFTGTLNSFMKTVINLSSYAGQSIWIRFRFSTDDNTAPTGGGWFVDDITLHTEPVVYMKSNLFNATAALLAVTDTVTRILPDANCTPAFITTQPQTITTCEGNTAQFSLAGSGSPNPSFQWQVNTGSGFTNISNLAPYSGSNASQLTVNGVTAAMNGYQYRSVVSNACGSVTSNTVSLVVTAAATILTAPANFTGCSGDSAQFTVDATGATGYQWQVNKGNGFNDISNTAPYSGAGTATLAINGISMSMNNYQYRVVLSSCGAGLTSSHAVLTIAAPATITSSPVNSTVCEGGNTSFSVSAGGSFSGYQWQSSSDGTNYTDLTGQTGAVVNVNAVNLAQSGTWFRAIVKGICGDINSSPAQLMVNAAPQFNLVNIPQSRCASDSAFTLTSTLAGGTWAGNGVVGNRFNPSVAGFGTATISYTISNSSGCSASQSANIVINDCPERHVPLNMPNSLLIYSNPNNGRFMLRILTDLYTKMSMKVYASDGKLAATREFTGLYFGRELSVDLSVLSGGVYHLLFYNNESGDFVKRSIPVIIAR